MGDLSSLALPDYLVVLKLSILFVPIYQGMSYGKRIVTVDILDKMFSRLMTVDSSSLERTLLIFILEIMMFIYFALMQMVMFFGRRPTVDSTKMQDILFSRHLMAVSL